MSSRVQTPSDSPPRTRAAGPPRPAAAPAPPPFSVVAVEDAAALEQYLPAWNDLASAVVEPNVFYESWLLLPALRAYARPGQVTVVLVFANRAPRKGGQPLLCGLFALERVRRFPVTVLRFWAHLHCYLAVPLIRTGFGPEVFEAFFDWLAADRRGAALLGCDRITGDGPFYHLLLEHVNARRRGMLLEGCHARALLRRGEGDRSPLARLSGEKRKKLRRAEERLAETGPLQYSALADDGDVEAWLADFLRLEASGWKRDAGTALACRDADRVFFLEAARAAFRQRRLMMLGLSVGGRVVAQLCNFLAGDGSFAFKVAFDEEFARFSPGALLELENLRQVEARPGLRWMDSCTDAGESLVNHLWADRRVIQTLLIETGRAPGPLVLAGLPLLRWLRRRLGSGLDRLRGRGRGPGKESA